MSEEHQEKTDGQKPWGLILISAFFILSLLAPVAMQMFNK